MEQKKFVPRRRFAEFKDEWEQRKFGDLGILNRGKSKHRPRNDEKLYGGIYPFIQTGNVANAGLYIDTYTQTYNEFGINQSKLWSEDTLLITIAANIADSTILKIKAAFPDSIIGFETIDNNIIFIKFSLDRISKMLRTKAETSSQANLNLNRLKDINFMVPSKKEQDKLGAFFKNIDKTITLQKTKIEKLKALKSAYLIEMFPQDGESIPKKRFKEFSDEWELKTLSSICSDISDGDWIETEYINDSGKYRIIQTGNLGVGKFLGRERFTKYINQKSFDTLKANEVFPGDILISRLAEPAGRSIIVPDIQKRMVTAVDVTIIRGNNNFDKNFIVTQLNSDNILSKINEDVSGTSHKRISRKNLEKKQLNVPKSIKEQQKIGQFFKNLDDQISTEEKKLKKLKQMKEAYLEEMFV